MISIIYFILYYVEIAIEINSSVVPKNLFVQIKSGKFQLNNNKEIIYAIETQNDIYLECQISFQFVGQPRIYWWFEHSDHVKRILQKPSNQDINELRPQNQTRSRRYNNNCF
jgi:hypothetical protein